MHSFSGQCMNALQLAEETQVDYEKKMDIHCPEN
jgi:hypothetical protein